jgi:hypothetical protein
MDVGVGVKSVPSLNSGGLDTDKDKEKDLQNATQMSQTTAHTLSHAISHSQTQLGNSVGGANSGGDVIVHDVEVFFTDLAVGISSGLTTGLSAGLWSLSTVADILTGGWIGGTSEEAVKENEERLPKGKNKKKQQLQQSCFFDEELLGGPSRQSTVRFNHKVETRHYEQSEEEIRDNAEWSQSHLVITKDMYED